MKGSITAEAACVCPMVLFSLILVWYLGCYQHNRVATQAVCREAVCKGLEAAIDGKDVRAAAQEAVKKQEKAFFMAEQTDAAIEASGRSIRVCVTVYMRFPFGIWKGTGVNGAWLIQEKSEASEESPVAVIRRLRRIKRLQGEDEDHDGRRSEGDDRELSGAGG